MRHISLFLLLFLISASARGEREWSNGEVIVHLFEWHYADIAKECETFLPGSGITAVQISPVNEHALEHGSPWYERYQPVSYKIGNRSGNESELRGMLDRCHAFGIKVIADVVINHMAILPGHGETRHGNLGTPYSRYDFPGLYSHWDFNQCGYYPPDDHIRNYHNRSEVQNCNLAGLMDLRTDHYWVKERIIEYLNKLTDIGIDGFRIDAAKHIPASHLKEILTHVERDPLIFSEVIDFGSEPISAAEYVDFGRVTAMTYGRHVSDAFRYGGFDSLVTRYTHDAQVYPEHAVVFVDNHDTQRGHGAGGNPLTYKDGDMYLLGQKFMLVSGFGIPKLMSSYRFSAHDQGPPTDSFQSLKRVWRRDGTSACGDEWICEHRSSGVKKALRFKTLTAGQPIEIRFTGHKQIVMQHGNRGLSMFNAADYWASARFATDLQPGRYCNLLGNTFDPRYGLCGHEDEYRISATTEFRLPPKSAIALERTSYLGP